MKKLVLLFLVWLGCGVNAFSQLDPVLLRVNGEVVTRSEFEYSFHKNNSMAMLEKKTPEEFLDLYIDYKLKVSAARSAGMDTTQSFKEELASYRRFLAKSYLTDTAAEEEQARKLYDDMKNSVSVSQVQVMHIFKYLPQNASATAIRNASSKMDSIYRLLRNHSTADFSQYVAQYSDDKNKFWVSWLQMPEEFEKVAFALNKNEFSEPFFSPQGIHIVKVLDSKSIPPFREMRGELIRRLTNRYKTASISDPVVVKLKKEYQFVSYEENVSELIRQGQTDRVLFKIGEKSYSGQDFLLFSKNHPRELNLQYHDFVVKSLLDYEDERLEQKYPDFKYLMTEYRDGILISEISNREVWGDHLDDEAELEEFFRTHKKDYYWPTPKFRGIVVMSQQKKPLKLIKKAIKKRDFDEWETSLKEKLTPEQLLNVQYELGLFAAGENKYVDYFIFKKEKDVPLGPFPYVNVWGEKIKGPEKYEDMRGPVMFDYQLFLEQEWVKKLRSKGKVEINQEVLKTVNNH